MYARELAMLRLVFKHERGARRVASGMSYREMASALEVSERQVAFTLRSLTDDGLVSVEERYLPNGGRLANAYRVTPAGVRLLKRCQVAEEYAPAG